MPPTKLFAGKPQYAGTAFKETSPNASTKGAKQKYVNKHKGRKPCGN